MAQSNDGVRFTLPLFLHNTAWRSQATNAKDWRR